MASAWTCSATYPDAGAAANKLGQGLDQEAGQLRPGGPNCHRRDKGPAVRGLGQDGAEISGSSFRVTQDTGTSTSTVIYRVAVVATENKVVYLLANLTKSAVRLHRRTVEGDRAPGRPARQPDLIVQPPGLRPGTCATGRARQAASGSAVTGSAAITTCRCTCPVSAGPTHSTAVTRGDTHPLAAV